MRPGTAFRSAALCFPLFLVFAAAAPGPPPMSPHEKAAREVIKLVGSQDLVESGADSLMDMLYSEADWTSYKDVVRDWYRKTVNESEIQEEMVKLYMETFSEKELREIAAFYKTPAGRKAIEILPELTKKGAELGSRQVEAHFPELLALLEKVRDERENQPAATDQEAQKRTVSQIRNTGTAMFSWLTDQVGAAAAGQSQTDMDNHVVEFKRLPPISHEELTKILVPQYIQKVPETDGWGHPYEYFLNVEDPMATQVMGVRSPGRDGRYSASDYTITAFDPEDFDEDIVWLDGFFVRWPQRE